jgi:protein-S-isoprenylcysteine O-methyltransferase Ste14
MESPAGKRGERRMIAWINLTVMTGASLLFLYFYVRSASRATRAKMLGARAYGKCARDRIFASAFEIIAVACYVVYLFFPLPVLLPHAFPWPWWLSALIAAAIGIPSAVLMGIGIRDGGEETICPREEHTMYGGIYRKLRHPQAVGEVVLWWVFAFFLNSPFLAAYSFIYIPIFMMMCCAEEQDLLWRYGNSCAEYCRCVGAFWPKRFCVEGV